MYLPKLFLNLLCQDCHQHSGSLQNNFCDSYTPERGVEIVSILGQKMATTSAHKCIRNLQFLQNIAIVTKNCNFNNFT